MDSVISMNNQYSSIANEADWTTEWDRSLIGTYIINKISLLPVKQIGFYKVSL